MRDEIGGLIKTLKSQSSVVNNLSRNEQQRINDINDKFIKIDEMTSSKNSCIRNQTAPRQNSRENSNCNYFNGYNSVYCGSGGSGGSSGGSYQNSFQENLNCSL
jgi:hypothetical protein